MKYFAAALGVVSTTLIAVALPPCCIDTFAAPQYFNSDGTSAGSCSGNKVKSCETGSQGSKTTCSNRAMRALGAKQSAIHTL